MPWVDPVTRAVLPERSRRMGTIVPHHRRGHTDPAGTILPRGCPWGTKKPGVGKTPGFGGRYFANFAYFALNFSIRPAVSSTRERPVQNGWLAAEICTSITG